MIAAVLVGLAGCSPYVETVHSNETVNRQGRSLQVVTYKVEQSSVWNPNDVRVISYTATIEVDGRYFSGSGISPEEAKKSAFTKFDSGEPGSKFAAGEPAENQRSTERIWRNLSDLELARSDQARLSTAAETASGEEVEPSVDLDVAEEAIVTDPLCTGPGSDARPECYGR